MEQLIRQILDKYFSDFKQYHLLILVITILVIALLQFVQSIYVNRRIEKFKNFLKKSEIKFSRFNELQINALRTIYHLLTNFQLSNDLIFKCEPDTIGHERLKKRIGEWIKNYIACFNEFSREKILLTKEIKDLFEKTLDDFQEIKNILIKESEMLEYMEMEGQGDWNLIYTHEQQELDAISDRISRLKNNPSARNSNNHIVQLRQKIEETFEQMN